MLLVVHRHAVRHRGGRFLELEALVGSTGRIGCCSGSDSNTIITVVRGKLLLLRVHQHSHVGRVAIASLRLWLWLCVLPFQQGSCELFA